MQVTHALDQLEVASELRVKLLRRVSCYVQTAAPIGAVLRKSHYDHVTLRSHRSEDLLHILLAFNRIGEKVK